MSTEKSEVFCLICLLICSCTAQTNITAELGQNKVTLPCKAPNKYNKNNIEAVKWSRPEMNPEYVLLYRDSKFISIIQHPSYQNRVDLQDEEMKDGDASMILKNVTKEDNGTYYCHTFLRGTSRKKRSNGDNELISTIILKVHPSGEKFEGNKGGITGDGGDKIGEDMVGISRGHPGVVGGILLLPVVLASLGFLMYKRSMRQNPNCPVPPDEPTAEQIP